MLLGPSLCAASPPCQAFEALALYALHLTVETSCHIFFLLRCEWSQSSHPTMRDRLAGIFVQAAFLVQHGGNLHSEDMLLPRFIWS